MLSITDLEWEFKCTIGPVVKLIDKLTPVKPRCGLFSSGAYFYHLSRICVVLQYIKVFYVKFENS